MHECEYHAMYSNDTATWNTAKVGKKREKSRGEGEATKQVNKGMIAS